MFLPVSFEVSLPQYSFPTMIINKQDNKLCIILSDSKSKINAKMGGEFARMIAEIKLSELQI